MFGFDCSFDNTDDSVINIESYVFITLFPRGSLTIVI